MALFGHSMRSEFDGLGWAGANRRFRFVLETAGIGSLLGSRSSPRSFAGNELAIAVRRKSLLRRVDSFLLPVPADISLPGLRVPLA